MIAVGAFDTPLLLTSGTFAVRSFNPLTTMVCLLLLFYTVESLCASGKPGSPRSLATPVKTGSILIGKALANSLVGVVVVLLELAWRRRDAALPGQGRQSTSMPFALVWGLLLVPTLLLWTSFVMASSALTRNRYATYAIAFAVIVFTGYRQIVGEMNWVGNWPLWSAVQWSDISTLEFDRPALWSQPRDGAGPGGVLHRHRGPALRAPGVDAGGIATRLRPAALMRPSAWLLRSRRCRWWRGRCSGQGRPGFQGKPRQEDRKDYWRKNLSTYNDWPLPGHHGRGCRPWSSIRARRLQVSGRVRPREQSRRAAAADSPDRRPPLGHIAWTLERQRLQTGNRSGLYIFTPPKATGDREKVKIGFQFEGRLPLGDHQEGGGNKEFILPSGVVLTSFGTQFRAGSAIIEQVGVEDDNKYESKEYPDDYYKGQTESLRGRATVPDQVTITAPDDFTYQLGRYATSKNEVAGRAPDRRLGERSAGEFLQHRRRQMGGAARARERRSITTPVHAYNVDEMVEASTRPGSTTPSGSAPIPGKS